MYTIRKLMKFEMAHKLCTSYTEACQNIHGHSYTLELFFRSKELNEDGMVIDFKLVKDKIKDYIDSWDHTLVLKQQDTMTGILLPQNISLKQVNYNPTAENMCQDMYQYIKERFSQLWKVRLHETETGWAEYEA